MKLSITLVFGTYGGFHAFWGDSIRACLGWVAFTIYPRLDIEDAMSGMMKELEDLKSYAGVDDELDD